MDAQTRHSLQQNELAEALQNLRDLGSHPQTRNWIIAIATVIILYSGWKLWSWSAYNTRTGAWADLDAALLGEGEAEQTIANLRNITRDGATESVRTAARLRLASLLVNQATDEAPGERLNEAAALLSTIADDPNNVAAYRAVSLFKLGTVHESLFEMDEARSAYERLTQDPMLAASPYGAVAQERLDTLDTIEQVEFTAGNKPGAVESVIPGLPPGVNPAELDLSTSNDNPGPPLEIDLKPNQSTGTPPDAPASDPSPSADDPPAIPSSEDPQ